MTVQQLLDMLAPYPVDSKVLFSVDCISQVNPHHRTFCVEGEVSHHLNGEVVVCLWGPDNGEPFKGDV